MLLTCPEAEAVHNGGMIQALHKDLESLCIFQIQSSSYTLTHKHKAHTQWDEKGVAPEQND